MVDDKGKGQRRVYVLPNELVERISEYQQEMGLSSEVEAVRRLLDDALKSRDDWMKIAKRFQSKLRETRFLTDVARDVLIGHPLVHNIGIKGNSISFELLTGESLVASDTGEVYVTDRHKKQTYLDKDGAHHDAPF